MTCSAEMFDANSDIPTNGQAKSRPARKYSVPERLLPTARRTAPTTTRRLIKITAPSTKCSIAVLVVQETPRTLIQGRVADGSNPVQIGEESLQLLPELGGKSAQRQARRTHGDALQCTSFDAQRQPLMSARV